MKTCETCKHAVPVTHIGNQVGYFTCRLQAAFIYRVYCNNGRHEPKAV